MIIDNDRGCLEVGGGGRDLSHYAEVIAEDNEQRNNKNLAKKQMTTEEIMEILNEAIIKNRSVCIQKEEKDHDGFYSNEIVGKIVGNDELGIYVDKNKIDYDEIRHIDFFSSLGIESFRMNIIQNKHYNM
ncbi:hypothetical protein [Enterococcus faecalis]|uniref:hypothetical protein n=1 Tax=Enterococcus faecalis TaxID=1351 RepID=UPI001D1670E6|nr:hypothetical protein [Enterococcus faecalis]